MAIVTHPDGYLQITEGHNWQDISDNGILQRIFKGWNERRLVAGLPLYWYGKNPNASILLGGDAQFTEFENPLLVPNPIYTIEDARIYPGAVLQNVAFWNFLKSEIKNIFRSPEAIEEGSSYWYYEETAEGGGDFTTSLITPEEFLPKIDDIDDVKSGDALALKQINDLLRILYDLRLASPMEGSSILKNLYKPPPIKIKEASTVGAPYGTCAEEYASANSQWYNDTREKEGGHYSFIAQASGSGVTVYNFEQYSEFTSSDYIYPAFPLNGEFILVGGNIFGGSHPDWSNGFIPPGQSLINKLPLNEELILTTDYMGFDITKPPLEIFGINCFNLTGYNSWYIIIVWIKPQFADLAPYVPNAYNYSINVSSIDQPSPI